MAGGLNGWPSEERVVEELFERRAHEGALLMTFNRYNFVRLRRKVGEIDLDYYGSNYYWNQIVR